MMIAYYMYSINYSEEDIAKIIKLFFRNITNVFRL